jgi:phospholipid transport system substrate-binding protein
MSHKAAPFVVRLALTICVFLALPRAAMAATPAESFVAGNIQAAMVILDDKQLTTSQRKAHFQDFLLGITDMKRIARFTLGKYAATASPAQQDAFTAAFQNYAATVYQSYFSRYSGQKLAILHTTERSPDDFIVATAMTSPGSSSDAPLEIDFRVRTDGPSPEIVDIGVSGVWLALAEQADFASVLDHNGGDIAGLTAHLNATVTKY